MDQPINEIQFPQPQQQQQNLSQIDSEEMKCDKHPDQNITMINLTQNSNNDQILLCGECINQIDSTYKLMPISIAIGQLLQKSDIIKNTFVNKILDNIRIIQDFVFQMTNFQCKIENIVQECKKHLERSIKELSCIHEEIVTNPTKYSIIKNIEYLRQQMKSRNDVDIFKIFEKINQSKQQTVNTIYWWVTETKQQHLKFSNTIHQFNFEFIKKEKLQENKYIKDQNKYIKNLNKQSKINSINKVTVKEQKRMCQALAFNYQNNILATGNNEIINIYDLSDKNQIQLLFTLYGHQTKIRCLNFSKTKNWLISADNNTIFLWKEQEQLIWKQNQQLVNQIDGIINSIVINKDENFLFSSSNSGQIIIWKINYNSNTIEFKQVQRYEINCYLTHNLEFNTMLINCQWYHKKINVNQGYFQNLEFQEECHIKGKYFERAEILSQNMILFQDYSGSVFIQEVTRSEYFDEQQELTKESLFPVYFNSQHQIVLIQQNCNVLLYTITDNYQLVEQKRFKFESDTLSGALSQNGTLIALWDNISKEIQLHSIIYK